MLYLLLAIAFPALPIGSLLSAPTPSFAADAAMPVAPPFWTGKPDSAGFRALCQGELKVAQDALDRMLAVTGGHTIENTLALYNGALLHADNAANASGLIESVHPDSTVRTVAEEMTR